MVETGASGSVVLVGEDWAVERIKNQEEGRKVGGGRNIVALKNVEETGTTPRGHGKHRMDGTLEWKFPWAIQLARVNSNDAMPNIFSSSL